MLRALRFQIWPRERFLLRAADEVDTGKVRRRQGGVTKHGAVGRQEVDDAGRHACFAQQLKDDI